MTVNNRPELPEIIGCGDGGCVWGHPGGMHTNGGCRCLQDLPMPKRHQAMKNIRALRAEIRRLRGQSTAEQP